MNLIDAFNLINNATGSLTLSRQDHEKIKEALETIAPVIKEKIEQQQEQAQQEAKE